MIAVVMSRILLTEAALLLLPLVVALLYGESVLPFLIPILILTVIGLVLRAVRPGQTALFARDGLAVVALAWIAMSAFGALPFCISGDIPHFVDAFFETVSGFTTTGASILTEVESLTYSGLFWRSFTHWVGGMGVLVFVMAILPMSDGHGMHLLRAEVPGPTVGKLVHSFGTAGTGGFSSRNLSVGAYDNAYFDVVIGVFMLLFGVNFNLYYFLLVRRFREVFHSEELRAYVLIVAAAVGAITVNILHMYGSVWQSLRHAFFQVSSIITTTGFATTDFNTWPTFSKAILVTLMFVGACAGSTGGGIKVARLVILSKTSLCDMRRMLHPNAVSTVRFEGKPMGDKQIRSVHLFLTVYLMVFCISCLLLSLEHMDLITTFTAVASCMNNIGPGLEIVGPMGNFSSFSYASKLLLSFDMLAGRLELFPMLLLFSPSIWKRRLPVRSSQN